jgi:hypothetical protein
MINLINWARIAENALVQYKAEVRNPSPIVLSVLNEVLLREIDRTSRENEPKQESTVDLQHNRTEWIQVEIMRLQDELKQRQAEGT